MGSTSLRRFLFLRPRGQGAAPPGRSADEPGPLNLVTNAIVTWNTVYMNAAVEQLRAEGRIDRNIELGHLSPALYGHINPYGKYRFGNRGSTGWSPTAKESR